MSQTGKDPERLDPLEADLDALFSEAKRAPIDPSADLMARILADAQAAQPAEPVIAVPRGAVSAGMLSRLLTMLGGWAGVASLSAATVAGVWIGVAGPETLTDPLFTVLGSESAFEAFDGASGFDFTTFEG